MDWSQQAQEGFALGAVAHGDKGAVRAARGLSPLAATSATRIAVQLGDTDRTARRAWVQRMLTAVPRVIDAPSDCPPRALALLAHEVDGALGRRWLARSEIPRAGYVPDPRLLACLRARLRHSDR